MRDIASLTSSLGFWDWVSYAATATVLIGVIGETVTGLFELITDTLWRKRTEKVSALILIVGLAGELLSQGKLSRISSQISAILNDEAGEAHKAAAEAIERAAIAESRIASAKASAAKPLRTAEQEHLARVRLEAQIAPRRLSVTQQRVLSAACKGFAGNSILLVSYSLDQEAAILGQQIGETLKTAGLKITENLAGFMPLGVFQTGVHVSGPKSEQALVKGLVWHLSLEGGLGTGVVPGEVRPDGSQVTILVGTKPLN